MTEIKSFPIRDLQKLDFDQAVHVTKMRNPAKGLIVAYDEDGDIMIFNFGEVTRELALWFSEQVKRHSQGEEIS